MLMAGGGCAQKLSTLLLSSGFTSLHELSELDETDLDSLCVTRSEDRAKLLTAAQLLHHYDNHGSTHRRTGHFLEGGWIDFARKIWGSARKMNSRTNTIKQDETRKLDCIDCGKSLKNLYLHLHCPFIIDIR